MGFVQVASSHLCPSASPSTSPQTEHSFAVVHVAAIEKSHEERYRALLNNVEMQQVFEKAEETMWECRNCGHLVMGKKAPEVCPVCAHPQSYFEVRKENY